MALATQGDGVSAVKENIFENRFMHVQELVRMGANIKVDGSMRYRARTVKAFIRSRHVLRLAGVGVVGARCAGSRRRVHPRSRLSHGSRL